MPLTQTFRALSDPNRRKILDVLKKSEVAVSDIAQHLDITNATLSHHLDILKRANLVSSRRNGQQIFYSLNLSVLEDMGEQILKFMSPKS